MEVGEPTAALIVCALGRTEPSRDDIDVIESSLGCRVIGEGVGSTLGNVGVVGVGGRGKGIDGGRVSEGEGGPLPGIAGRRQAGYRRRC